MSWVLLGTFFALSLVGIPLAISLGLATILTLVLFDLPLSLIAQRMYSSMNSFLLVAVPLFILAGSVMGRGGVSDRIFFAANSVVGRWRGGLGQVNIIASMIFGGISGSSVADVSGLGPLEIKAMEERRYPKPYAAALTMVTATLASVVPPSILMIIAATAAGQSVGASLAGGLGPAVVFAVMFIALNYWLALRRGYGDVVSTGFREAVGHVLIAIPALGAPVIILGGIFGGIMTPTEAAGMAVLYALAVGALIYRRVNWREVPRMIIDTGVTTGTILFIAMCASVATYVFTVDGLPGKVTNAILSLSQDPTMVLLLMGVVLVVVGMFMDIIAAILILTPVLMPTAMTVGINPIHFVVFLVTALAVGLSTPPVGICLFATAQVSGISVERITQAALPFYVVMLIGLVVLAAFPALTLFPVRLFM
ncbi:TRAP transporter large permease [Spiribacter halobius]|uniref:TRAP transporter large permease protein n=1 Tax=Sediminicurvatus halobius TaxID=2182432 RepID=A0A2U2MXD1_9GAMM|nr:TRAP transporter large permease [Spiribacter halobius]PWG61528.1 ABC transporter permease [Spiribacter halobius]UEX78007.1 TRAP transporter large permease [Spiribacter halobius]